MSLGKLLTTGKSLVGLRDSSSRYQLQKGALPKFESSKNPFAPRPRAEAPAPIVEREPQLPEIAPVAPAPAPVVTHKKAEPLPAAAVQPNPAPKELKPVKPVPVAAPSPVVDGWVKKLNPMIWWKNRKPSQPKSAIPRFNKGPVQGELSLDNIKVMRNDLSDTDVEVVPMKARAAKAMPAPQPVAPAITAAAVPELPSATNAWEYLGERLLGKH